MDSGGSAVRKLRELLEKAGDAIDELRDAGDTMEELSSLTSDIMEDLSHVLQELSEMPTHHHPSHQQLRSRNRGMLWTVFLLT